VTCVIVRCSIAVNTEESSSLVQDELFINKCLSFVKCLTAKLVGHVMNTDMVKKTTTNENELLSQLIFLKSANI